MQEVNERIMKDMKCLCGGIISVGHFNNYQIDLVEWTNFQMNFFNFLKKRIPPKS
jgi:hypothetical protein